MEVRVVGSVEEPRLQKVLQLLTALAGHEPAPIHIHDMTMRCEGASRNQEIQLRHSIIPASNASDESTTTSKTPGAERWAVYQYSRPPWGDLKMAKLPATVRTVTQASCSGPNVPNFYKGLGFLQQYQHFKKGFAFDIQRGTWKVHILVSRLHRVVEDTIMSNGDAHGGGGNSNNFREEGAHEQGTAEVAVVAGEEVAPGHMLLEVWTEVPAEKTHTEAISALLEVGKQLAGEGVVLQPLPAVDLRNRMRGAAAAATAMQQ